MIRADFFRNSRDMLTGFSVKGHAGMADFGSDVCCASVSSAVMMTANTITEIYKLTAEVTVDENEIALRLGSDENGDGDRLILGLLTHLDLLCDEFPGHIKLRVNAA
ncbi:ribosomal-processing cysteine protease Prp [uncultured Ruminococcus sp.]|uniref:ribosomal-processing cysteine protease Prp n=1 Tax=uncultured Ruminococcus sp. TaxID=165186 RepID=UPI0025E19FA4|nr:ribosomal-processing cysteine protease Prp [uncultured Ruminococcus sp.]